jgi:hypothetical protein
MDMHNSIATETATPSQQVPQARKRFGKKIIALAAALLVIVAYVAFLAPQGAATIPLNVDYTVGEKMVYDANITVSMAGLDSILNSTTNQNTPSTISSNATLAVEVMSFDGETYTLNNTTTMDLLGKTQSISMIEKINKTGFSTFMFNAPTQDLSYSPTSSILTSLLNRPDVKVGETWEVPINGLDGNLTLTFNGIQDITVPAGTYKVYKVSLSSDNLSTKNQIPASLSNQTIQVKMTMNGETYIEYNTGRQIKYNMESTTSAGMAGMELTIDMCCQMTLTHHIKP